MPTSSSTRSGVAAEGDGHVVFAAGESPAGGADRDTVGASLVLPDHFAQLDAESIRHGPEVVLDWCDHSNGPANIRLTRLLGLEALPDLPLDHAGRGSYADVPPRLLAVDRRKPSQVGFDKGPDLVDLERADDDEGEIRRVGEAVQVEGGGCFEVDLLERCQVEDRPARMVLRQRDGQRVGEGDFGIGIPVLQVGLPSST